MARRAPRRRASVYTRSSTPSDDGSMHSCVFAVPRSNKKPVVIEIEDTDEDMDTYNAADMSKAECSKASAKRDRSHLDDAPSSRSRKRPRLEVEATRDAAPSDIVVHTLECVEVPRKIMGDDYPYLELPLLSQEEYEAAHPYGKDDMPARRSGRLTSGKVPRRRYTEPVVRDSGSEYEASDNEVKAKVGGEMTSCHQCRRSTTILKMRCRHLGDDGRVCTLQFCKPCVDRRYNFNFDGLAPGFHCPRCLNFCNCSICLRKRGLGHVLDGSHQTTTGRCRSLNTVISPGETVQTYLHRNGYITEGGSLPHKRTPQAVPGHRVTQQPARLDERPNPTASDSIASSSSAVSNAHPVPKRLRLIPYVEIPPLRQGTSVDSPSARPVRPLPHSTLPHAHARSWSPNSADSTAPQSRGSSASAEEQLFADSPSPSPAYPRSSSPPASGPVLVPTSPRSSMKLSLTPHMPDMHLGCDLAHLVDSDGPHDAAYWPSNIYTPHPADASHLYYSTPHTPTTSAAYHTFLVDALPPAGPTDFSQLFDSVVHWDGPPDLRV